MSERWTHRLTALVLFAMATTAVVASQRGHGVVRDEVVYMDAGSRYVAWWGKLLSFEAGALSEEQITAHFGGARVTDNNSEHPPLMKTLFGLSERLFGDSLGKTTAYRLPNAILYGVLVALVFAWVRRVWGYSEAVVAALLTLLLPRALFHAGLAAFDAPVVTLWMATLYAYYRSLERPIAWGLLFGVFFGLTLATKHNAIILPAAVVTHWVWVVAGEVRAGTRVRAALWRRGPLTLPAMLVVGPLVLVAVWPWLWFDTFEHAGRWMQFHFDHVHYNFEYLGDNWNHPPFPWHVAIVTTLFTVPVVTLVAGAIGAVALLLRWRAGQGADPARAPALLLFLSAGVSMGPFLLRSTPIFGAEKHWAPAIPTICIFAGIGVVVAARLLVERLHDAGLVAATERARRLALVSIATLVIGAAMVETIDAQPYALTHYNALAGGAPGGADLGMNRQFWGYSARGALPWLNRYVRERGGQATPIYTHDASMAWGLYRRDGLVDPALADSGNEYRGGIARARLAIVVHELHFNRHDYLIWDAFGTVQPVFVLTTDGVPIVSVYAREP